MEKLKDIITIFNENIEENDLFKQNKQIEVLIDSLKNIKQDNLNKLSKKEREINPFKIGDLITIQNDKFNDIHYIKDIRFDVPSFPSKIKENVLILETINLSNPSTYFFNSRDNKIPTRNLELSELKVLNHIQNLDYNTIKEFLENNAKYNQIIISRLVFNSSENQFNLNKTNEIVKNNIVLFHELEGIELLKKNPNFNSLQTYSKINDFEIFSMSYRDLYLKLNKALLSNLKPKDYDKKLEEININLLSDLNELSKINEKQIELSNKIFDFTDIHFTNGIGLHKGIIIQEQNLKER